MAGRRLVVLGYILAFWGALPGALVALAAWGERLLGPRLSPPGLRPAGLALAAASGAMLAVSIVQFTRATGHLPISAFPPRRLIRSGVFGIWRHPIYLFFTLAFGGLAVGFWPTGALLVSLPVLAVTAFVYAGSEERGLERRFGRFYEGHRRQTSVLVPRLIHVVRGLFALLARLFFRFEVSGREHRPPDPPYIVVSAHRSFLDPFFVLAALGAPLHFITTSSMFRKPLPRLVFSRLLGLPVTRYRPDVRNALLVRRRLRQGCVIGMFPESERTWTDSMAGFKPEALRLLRDLRDIPILPVRLEGTYAVWPRWARRPRRGKVSARFERPILAGPGESPAELEARLSGLIAPRAPAGGRPRPIAASGIETVIYRCPDCLRFDTVRSGRGARFGCSSCRAEFDLLPDFSVRRTGGPVRSSLTDLSRLVRLGPEAGPSCGEPCRDPARAKLAAGTDGRLEPLGPGRLRLSARELVFESAGPAVRVGLGDIRALVIEGARKLEVYGGRPARLYQFTLLDQSALKWQDAVSGTVRSLSGVPPGTT